MTNEKLTKYSLGTFQKLANSGLMQSAQTYAEKRERVGDFEILRDSRIRILPPINFNFIRILFEVFRQ